MPLLGLTPLAVPPHVFALDARALRYAHIARQGRGFRLRAWRELPLPADAFHSGLLGGTLRDPAAFGERLAGFVAQLPGPIKAASLVLPDAWLRVAFSESGELPRGGQARDDVLRWKLRRLVPFRVDELRVAGEEVAPLPAQAGSAEPRRVLLGFALEQLLGQLEDAFAGAKVRIGQVTNASLALAAALEPPAGGGVDALAVVEGEGYSLIFARATARGAEPLVHRYKGLGGGVPEGARTGLVARDLKLTANFLLEHLGGARLGRVVLAAPPEAEAVWLDRLREGLGVAAQPLDGRHLPPVVAEGESAPWRAMAPLLGAARREVL
ncbi:MAG TPA: hypothetical protein VF121_12655 [Thermoanaerobaculia bacterium]|nr:hypothetical protein [Thermoanaerobaculia bacterium]